MTSNLNPMLKWAGGKEQELKHIHPAMPKDFDRYFEPFVGGGSVYFSIGLNNKKIINDKSDELIRLYKCVAEKNSNFFEVMEEIIHNWNLLEKITLNNGVELISIYQDFAGRTSSHAELKNRIAEFIITHSKEFNGMFSRQFNFDIENFICELNKCLLNKIARMKVIELSRGTLPDSDILENLEAAIKAAFYTHFRHIYNNFEKYRVESSFQAAIFFFIRNFAYSGMFRYNSSGKFNVPYGGIGYNRKNMEKKLTYLKSQELNDYLCETQISNLDFDDFFKEFKPTKNDFIFLDPPYDSEFSTYGTNEFNRDDQARLARYLTKECPANWMIVIKNTPFIFELYNKSHLNVSSFSKKYLVSFQNRNDKNAEHLIIRNYSH